MFGVFYICVFIEFRLGYVVFIVGFYEDVLVVIIGWKMNLVNFDSVFNCSRYIWSWGSFDILLMFEYGVVFGRVDVYMYGYEMEDFLSDVFVLDFWVFDYVKELFVEVKMNKMFGDVL